MTDPNPQFQDYEEVLDDYKDQLDDIKDWFQGDQNVIASFLYQSCRLGHCFFSELPPL